MTTTSTPVQPRRSRRPTLEWLAPVALLVGAAMLVAHLSRSSPDRQSIQIQNRTGASVTVRVTGDPGDGWLGLGTVDPEGRSEFREVFDQGDLWHFRLSVGPDIIREFTRSARQLRAADWTITVPAGAADALAPSRRAWGS